MSITNTGISGLRAATADLKVTGDNIANAGTIGFKESRTEFSTIYSEGGPGTQIGNGVQVAGVSQDFSSVGVSITGSSYDLAINGEGFFPVNGGSDGIPKYTRSGNFTRDDEGYFVTQSGERLQGYTAIDGEISATMGDLRIPNDSISPQPTSTLNLTANLDANSEVLGLTFDDSDPSTYNERLTLNTYDSLGGAHLVNTFYAKTADNTWDVHVESEGTTLASGNIAFNPDGSLLSETGLDAVSWDPGNGAASGQLLDFNYGTTTQYGSPTSVIALDIDGYATGRPSQVNIDNNGIISVLYTNGRIESAGQVAVAKFDNPQGLFAVGNSSWTETGNSGIPIITTDNSTGSIRSGALEDSNVDLTEQLVKLITAQRNFQANAQSIQAGDVLTQTIINIG